jgi:hypothetical protein
MEVCQVELTARTQRLVCGFLDRCTDITEDCRVNTIVEGGICSVVWLGTYPVIVDGLVGIENEGVSLSSKNLNSIHSDRVGIHGVSLDNREIMTFNGKDIVWIAGYGDEAESVAFTVLHRDDRKLSCSLERSSAVLLAEENFYKLTLLFGPFQRPSPLIKVESGFPTTMLTAAV